MTHADQLFLFDKSAIALAESLLKVFGKVEAERIARERISRYAAGTAKTDPYLIGFWSEVLKHVKTMTLGDLTAIKNPWDLAALNSCVERMRAS